MFEVTDEAGMGTKLLSLQVARGVAANLVVLQHLTEFEAKYADTKLPVIAHYGDLGVDVFFVLSGFVMAAIAGRDVGPLEFLWRRAARIYPTYWLATLLMLGIAFAAPELVHEPIDTLPWWRSFLLVAASPRQPIVSVGWTLVHEVYFYLVFAGFLTFRIPIVTGTIVWAVIWTTTSILFQEYIATSPVLSMATSPLTFEFMMGLLIGALWMRHRTRRSLLLGITGGMLLLLSIVLHFHFFATETYAFGDSQSAILLRVVMFGVPIAVILYALVAYERETPCRPPALLVALGDWSYSTYLFHFMVLSAIGRAVFLLFAGHAAWASVVLFAFGYLAVNLLGATSFVVFERPTLRWLNRFGRPKAPRLAEAAVADPIRSQ
jgi:exopolysaccharide production protein ExoZ